IGFIGTLHCSSCSKGLLCNSNFGGVRFMKSIFLAAIAAGMLTTAAQAADLPPRPGPVPYQAPILAPLFTWTGVYIGSNIGGGWFNGSIDSDFGSAWKTNGSLLIGG